MSASGNGDLSKRRSQDLNNEIDELKKAIDGFDKIDSRAESYSKSSTSSLYGVVGGVTGGLIGTCFISVSAGLVVVIAPAGMILGAAIGILLFRGPKTIRRDRTLDSEKRNFDEFEKRLGLLCQELKTLPESVPDEIKCKLWQAYTDVYTAYASRIISLISIDTNPVPQITSKELVTLMPSTNIVKQIEMDAERS